MRGKSGARWAAVVLVASMGLATPGCGPAEQKYEEQVTTIPTPLENIKTSLRSVLANGQTDSGTGLMKDELEKLRGTEGIDVDSLQKTLDQLLSAQSPAQVKAKANEMLNKLPQ